MKNNIDKINYITENLYKNSDNSELIDKLYNICIDSNNKNNGNNNSVESDSETNYNFLNNKNICIDCSFTGHNFSNWYTKVGKPGETYTPGIKNPNPNDIYYERRCKRCDYIDLTFVSPYDNGKFCR